LGRALIVDALPREFQANPFFIGVIPVPVLAAASAVNLPPGWFMGLSRRRAGESDRVVSALAAGPGHCRNRNCLVPMSRACFGRTRALPKFLCSTPSPGVRILDKASYPASGGNRATCRRLRGLPWGSSPAARHVFLGLPWLTFVSVPRPGKEKAILFASAVGKESRRDVSHQLNEQP